MFFRSDGLERAFEFEDDVVDMLKADREADEFRQDSAFLQVFVGELRVGRRGRVYHEAFRVADVGEERENLAVERVGETSGFFRAALLFLRHLWYNISAIICVMYL